jgi:hypothetical protein
VGSHLELDLEELLVGWVRGGGTTDGAGHPGAARLLVRSRLLLRGLSRGDTRLFLLAGPLLGRLLLSTVEHAGLLPGVRAAL